MSPCRLTLTGVTIVIVGEVVTTVVVVVVVVVKRARTTSAGMHVSNATRSYERKKKVMGDSEAKLQTANETLRGLGRGGRNLRGAGRRKDSGGGHLAGGVDGRWVGLQQAHEGRQNLGGGEFGVLNRVW